MRAISWNLFHGRDAPPDPELRTCRSRLLGLTETSATHVQVNRPLLDEFATVLNRDPWGRRPDRGLGGARRGARRGGLEPGGCVKRRDREPGAAWAFEHHPEHP